MTYMYNGAYEELSGCQNYGLPSKARSLKMFFLHEVVTLIYGCPVKPSLFSRTKLTGQGIGGRTTDKYK